jgi:hypothetical protein
VRPLHYSWGLAAFCSAHPADVCDPIRLEAWPEGSEDRTTITTVRDELDTGAETQPGGQVRELGMHCMSGPWYQTPCKAGLMAAYVLMDCIYGHAFDRFVAIDRLPGSQCGFFAVYDGHGGDVSQFTMAMEANDSCLVALKLTVQLPCCFCLHIACWPTAHSAAPPWHPAQLIHVDGLTPLSTCS